MSIGKFNWKSVKQTAKRVAKWPDWKRKYRIGEVTDEKIDACELNLSQVGISMHPGEYIIESYLYSGGLTRNKLAEKLNVSQSTISRILNGRVDITASMAVRLERVLGRSAKSWLSMQADYNLEKAYNEVDVSSLGA